MGKRGATDLSGILLIDKPAGITSHDVVSTVRRATGERRVGHAGTLDPMATGLLVVLLGPATRLAPFLTNEFKSYRACVTFGAQTDTDDAEGQVIETAPVSPDVLQRSHALRTLDTFIGPAMQMPPAYSAIKVSGQTAHRVARSGGTVELQPREIEVRSARLVDIEDDPPRWNVDFDVSKGTYIRSLARDLGLALGTRAHLSALRRTASGVLTIDGAHGLDEICSTEGARALFVDPVTALGLPVRELGEEQAADVAVGRSIAAEPHAQQGARLALVREGVLLAVYDVEGETARPIVVFPGGIAKGAQ